MKKVIKAAGLLSIAGCALIYTPLAMAEDSGWYIGANIGPSISHLDAAGITTRVGGAGLATSAITRDERDIGYKLFGGYQINRNFALEGGYFDLGQFGFTSTTTPAGTLTGNLEVRGMNLDVVGMLPITEQFSAFGRAGVTYAQTSNRVRLDYLTV